MCAGPDSSPVIMESEMKHLIYAAVAVSALGLATGAFACGAHQHTASLANGKIILAQQDPAPAMQNPSDNQDNSATDEDNSKE
jgi:hypothetical protein